MQPLHIPKVVKTGLALCYALLGLVFAAPAAALPPGELASGEGTGPAFRNLGVCGPGQGDCCTPHAGTPGCEDEVCCKAVCACDSFCCDVEWDAFCATDGFPGTGCGAAILCVQCGAPPCDVTCDAAKTLENEPDCGLPADTVNGGCNASPPVFSPIACGESYCASGAFDGAGRDSDWYQITVFVETEFTWTVEAEFDLLMGMVVTAPLGTADCATATALDPMAAVGPCTPVSVTRCGPPGTYWWFVAPQFTAIETCGADAEYTATLTCAAICPTGACCNQGACAEVSTGTCTSGGGTYQGDGTPCTPNPCPQPCTSDAECDDDQFCNGAETCDLGTGQCVPGAPSSCPGTTQCSNGVCDPAANGGAGGCVVIHEAAGTVCGNPENTDCDHRDTCDGTGACQANHDLDGTPCTDDGNECTQDVCSNGNCAHNALTCDCDGDGILDGDETNPAEQDCDGDGICNGVEIVNCPPGDSTCADCNGNNVPDGCEPGACCLLSGPCVTVESTTCAGMGGSPRGPCSNCVGDTNGDGVDQRCEGDCDANGISDGNETDPAQGDCDRDGICNGVEIANCAGDPACGDLNANGIPDGCEADCDMDGIVDSYEIANCPPGDLTCTDCNSNGVPDGCEADCNNNGIADGCDIADCPPGDISCADCNNNGIPDDCEFGACCYKPFGSPTCFVGPRFGPFPSCEYADIFLGGSTWYGPCRNCDTFQGTTDIVEQGGIVFHHQVGSPEDCPAELPPGLPRVARGDCTGPFIDPWKSKPSEGTMCHNFGATGGGPIPADFFCPDTNPNCNSDVFDDVVCLDTAPLGMTPYGDFGEADTLIRRTQDPFGRCTLPPLGPVSVDIDIVALNLINVAPLLITYNGGQDPEEWDLRVDLSTTVTPPLGTLTATKTHCNGGTYTSSLNVQPRFTFTRLTDGLVRVFDTGTAELLPITLSQTNPAPWVHDVDPNLAITFDPCSEFHAGIEEPGAPTECDCNMNSTRDQCDIELGASVDCNQNEIPDSCDLFICDDANGCTDDACGGTNCTFTPNAAACDDGFDCTMNDACAAGSCHGTSIVTLYGDVAPRGGNALIDVDDILYVLNSFIDPDGFPDGDITPCGGNGLVDVDDIVAELNAFTGFFACPHPCPP